jgi:DNA-binding transcriptional ArsR family regulator
MGTLDRRVADLEARVARLEAAAAGTAPAATVPEGVTSTQTVRAAVTQAAEPEAPVAMEPPAAPGEPAVPGEVVGPAPAAPRTRLDQLERLRAELGGERDGRAGVITYGGAARLDGGEHLWLKEHRVPDLAEADWTAAARVLERLGSPSRLALLAALLGRAKSRRELQDALGETSTGHLYHHLRDLGAAGLLVQRRRGAYELAPQTVMPLLAIIAAALDLGTAPVGAEEADK